MGVITRPVINPGNCHIEVWGRAPQASACSPSAKQRGAPIRKVDVLSSPVVIDGRREEWNSVGIGAGCTSPRPQPLGEIVRLHHSDRSLQAGMAILKGTGLHGS
jgi:hypothetical protein